MARRSGWGRHVVGKSVLLRAVGGHGVVRVTEHTSGSTGPTSHSLTHKPCWLCRRNSSSGAWRCLSRSDSHSWGRRRPGDPALPRLCRHARHPSLPKASGVNVSCQDPGPQNLPYCHQEYGFENKGDLATSLLKVLCWDSAAYRASSSCFGRCGNAS